MTLQGASFQERRVQRKGEEWALFISPAHKFTAISLLTHPSFESISGQLKYTDLQNILSSFRHDLVLMGNFNLHTDSSSLDVRELIDSLKSLDLDQYVDFPTHIHGYFFEFVSKGCDVLSVSTSDNDLRLPFCCCVPSIKILSHKLSSTGS